MKKRDNLVIRTEAEALRDHAHTWLWGFICGVLFGLAMAYLMWAALK